MTLLAAKAKAERAAATARQDSQLAVAELADAIAELAKSVREELDDLRQRIEAAERPPSAKAADDRAAAGAPHLSLFAIPMR